jgi:hypothetical protein
VASPQYLHRSNNQDIYCRVEVVVLGHWGEKMAQRLGDIQLADRTPFPQFPLLTYPSSFDPTSSPAIPVPFSKKKKRIGDLLREGKVYADNVFNQSVFVLCSNTALVSCENKRNLSSVPSYARRSFVEFVVSSVIISMI